jgi:hypothetical protein
MQATQCLFIINTHWVFYYLQFYTTTIIANFCDISCLIYQLKFTALLFFSYCLKLILNALISKIEKLDDFGKLIHKAKLNSAHAFLDRHIDWSGRLLIINI